MSEKRQCPMCHRWHAVADDGTIPTWLVTWTGDAALVTMRERKLYLSTERQQRLDLLREKYGRTPPEIETTKVGFISNRSSCFIHYEDAIAEYDWIKGILSRRGDWETQKAYLALAEGERASWYDLFESPDAYWEA